MAKHWHLIPAYGRDYKGPTEVRLDFESNRDFLIADVSDRYDGKPVNREQMSVGDVVTVRYAGLRRVYRFVVGAVGEWKLADALTKVQKAALLEPHVARAPAIRSLMRLGLIGADGDRTRAGSAVRSEIIGRMFVRMRCALGRIFALMSRQAQVGDAVVYEACRAAILDASEPQLLAMRDNRPNYARERLNGARGD